MPNVCDILLRLTEKVERANTIQHSGGNVRKADWSELRQLTNEARSALAEIEQQKYDDKMLKPDYYLCGGCCHYHPKGWTGDCRDDANRFTQDDLDEKHGAREWCEVDE